jgi:hypothetical protein
VAEQILEFQVTSLPKSYFNIFKEQVSKKVRLWRIRFCGHQRYKLYRRPAISFFTKTTFLRTLLQKADAKISALKSILQIFPNFFLTNYSSG